MNRFSALLLAAFLSSSAYAQDYVSPKDTWRDIKGNPLVFWRINGGDISDQEIVKQHIDELYDRWNFLTNYKYGNADGGKKFFECVDRNAQVNIASASKGNPYSGSNMIGEINWHVFRYQLMPQPHVITVNLNDDQSFCSLPNWAGCAELDTWPNLNWKETPFIPGWSFSPEFLITLRIKYLREQAAYHREWAGVILHELLHNLGWKHSSYNGNVQMVSMEKCFVNTDYNFTLE